MSILVTTDGPVARITLDRPDALNALTAEMLDDLADALERLGTEPAISVIVVRGAGRAFSAGVDLKALGGRPIPNGAVGDVLDVPAASSWLATGPRIRLRRLASPSPFTLAWIAPGAAEAVRFDTPADALKRLHARMTAAAAGSG